jgi:hypothetical protein
MSENKTAKTPTDGGLAFEIKEMVEAAHGIGEKE